MAGRNPKRYSYWRKQKIAPQIIEKKYREALPKANFDRKDFAAYQLLKAERVMLRYNVSSYELIYMLFMDRYEFVTLNFLIRSGSRPMSHAGEEAYEDDKGEEQKRLWQAVKRRIIRMQTKGWVTQPIRNWDLDDNEYKGVFGQEKNRHNYRKRYALSMLGQGIVDKVYEALAE